MAIGTKIDNDSFQVMLDRLKALQERDPASLSATDRENLSALSSVEAARIATPPPPKPVAKPKAARAEAAPPQNLLEAVSGDSSDTPILTTSERRSKKPSAASVSVKVVQDHPTEVGLNLTANKIVKSVDDLRGETKTGLNKVTDAIKSIFGSARSAGGGKGPTGHGPTMTGPEVYTWPNGPWVQSKDQEDIDRRSRYGSYTAEADKHIQYRPTWVEKKKSEWLTVDGLKDKLFDKNSMIGGFVNRKLEQHRDAKEFAQMQEAHADKLGVDKKTAKEYKADFLAANKLRGEAAKHAATLDRMEAQGWDEDVIRESDAFKALHGDSRYATGSDQAKGLNERVFEKDPLAREQYNRWKAKKEGQRDKGDSETTEGSSSTNRERWSKYADDETSASSGTAARSEATTQSSKESEEENIKAQADRLKLLEKIEKNTAPIIDIAKILGADTDGAGASSDTAPDGTPKKRGFFQSVVDKGKELVETGLELTGARKVLNRVSGLGGGMVGKVAGAARAAGTGLLARAAAVPAVAAAGQAVAGGVSTLGALAAGAGEMATGALALAATPEIATAAALVAGTAAVGYGLYKGYQWLTGGSEEDGKGGKTRRRAKSAEGMAKKYRHAKKMEAKANAEERALKEEVGPTEEYTVPAKYEKGENGGYTQTSSYEAEGYPKNPEAQAKLDKSRHKWSRAQRAKRAAVEGYREVVDGVPVTEQGESDLPATAAKVEALYARGYSDKQLTGVNGGPKGEVLGPQGKGKASRSIGTDGTDVLRVGDRPAMANGVIGLYDNLTAKELEEKARMLPQGAVSNGRDAIAKPTSKPASQTATVNNNVNNVNNVSTKVVTPPTSPTDTSVSAMLLAASRWGRSLF